MGKRSAQETLPDPIEVLPGAFAKSMLRLQRVGLGIVTVCVCLLTASTNAAELKQKTAEAFEHYRMVTESRMAGELSGGAFFCLDSLPQENRQRQYAQLRQGQLYTERLETRENGEPIKIPEGMVHNWVGMVFIPGATLQQALAVLQDYDNHQNIYRPYVRRSKLLQHDANNFKVYLQFYRKAIVTVVLNAEFDVRYFPIDLTRVRSRSYSTRIAEVENSGQSNEREKPAISDHGFLWRLYSYARLEEKDGGVYFQLEYIALSRRVPTGLGWLINPFLSRIPRETLSLLLGATRRAVNTKSLSQSTTGELTSLHSRVHRAVACEDLGRG